MSKNKHLLLWSSLGTLALLIYAAVQENFLKEWRQIQVSATTNEGPIDVHLRQVVVPGLEATDRCVTCHVGMGPTAEPIAGAPVTGPHASVVHDPAEFGCTVCHGGQGLATEKADAHGDVPFWPEPMIPLEHAQAGCGSCHTLAGIPDLAGIQEARNVFERHDCFACHRIGVRGGTLRPGGGGMEGPELSHVGVGGYDPAWYEQHLKQHQRAAEGPWQTAFGPISEKDREQIVAFLALQVGADRLVRAKATFHSRGCQGCHKVGNVGGDDGPELTKVGDKNPHQLDFSHVEGAHTLANWHAQHLRDPNKVVADSQMPDQNLSDEEIELLTLYILSLRRKSFPDAYWPRDRVRTEKLDQREFASDGATLYAALCSACHGPQGHGRRLPGQPAYPSLANEDFLTIASDDFLRQNILRGRAGRRMPAWGESEGGLRTSEIDHIIAHLRTIGNVDEPEDDTRPERWVQADPARGERLYATHCAACHGPNGEGTEAPALNHQVLLETATDTYLVETVGRGRRDTAMPGFQQPSLVRPTLTSEDIESLVAFIRKWEKTSP